METGLQSAESIFAGSSESLNPLREAFTALRAELVRMPADERQSQAWIASSQGDLDSRLVPAGTPVARPLVAVNPAYFDRSRSRADWQLITVSFFQGGSSEQHIGVVRLQEFRATADWKRGAALINP